jgi:hypothetical protein
MKNIQSILKVVRFWDGTLTASLTGNMTDYVVEAEILYDEDNNPIAHFHGTMISETGVGYLDDFQDVNDNPDELITAEMILVVINQLRTHKCDEVQ